MVEKDKLPISYNEYWYNNKKLRGFYENGLKDSIWISWYTNGNINTIIPYTNNKINGYYYQYLEDGRTISIERYVDGIFSPALFDEYVDI